MAMTEYQLIKAISERAAALYKQLIASEIMIVHNEIVTLRLQEFLEADDSNFSHDIAGIHRHLEISKSPKLKDCFLPRFAKV